jgi:hypothetical protein
VAVTGILGAAEIQVQLLAVEAVVPETLAQQAPLVQAQQLVALVTQGIQALLALLVLALLRVILVQQAPLVQARPLEHLVTQEQRLQLQQTLRQRFLLYLMQ